MRVPTQEEFINDMKKLHPSLDFSKAMYVGSLAPVNVICTKHNIEFSKTPKVLKIGQGCPECGKEILASKLALSPEVYTDRIISKWGNRFDLSETSYINSSTDIKIICNNHGPFFVNPSSFLSLKGEGCPKCSRESGKSTIAITQDEFVDRSKKVHEGKGYTYELCTYKNYSTKVVVNCHKENHGPFSTLPGNHMNGSGCHKCGRIKAVKDRVNTKFEEGFRDIHGDKYDYSKVVYINNKKKVEIICNSCEQSFMVSPSDHTIKHSGCPYCSKNKVKTIQEFVAKAVEVHGDRYTYNNAVYVNNKTKLQITCKIHGDFLTKPNWHVSGNNGCPNCQDSLQELELSEFLKSLGVVVDRKNRSILKPQELDILLPDFKIAIEYNGLHWHSEKYGKDQMYHLNKTIKCKELGIRLIHIFEDEWVNRKDIVKNRLSHILGKSLVRLQARKLIIKKIEFLEGSKFLGSNHIQGSGQAASCYYGLYNGVELVACMSFCCNRFNNSNAMEILRFASKYSIVGGFSRLLKSFIRDNPLVKQIISYSDKRWSEGAVYINNKFMHAGSSVPGYDYVKRGDRFNRQKFMKHKLPNLFSNYNENLTEHENCANNGFYRLWNCGMDKWELNL